MTRIESSTKGIYGPVVLFVALFVGIAALGVHTANQRAASLAVPDVVMTYQDCEYHGDSSVMIRGVMFESVSTSCGVFNKPGKDWGFVKGEKFDIEVTKSAVRGKYISDVAPSLAAPSRKG